LDVEKIVLVYDINQLIELEEELKDVIKEKQAVLMEKNMLSRE
jgi:hypothetical protein